MGMMVSKQKSAYGSRDDKLCGQNDWEAQNHASIGLFILPPPPQFMHHMSYNWLCIKSIW